MKGFLIKDIYLLLQRKQILFMLAAVCAVMAFSTDGSFIVGYMAFLSVILAVSTISYDDADNGMMFLMTLPAGSSSYAVSKYVLGVLLGAVVWVFAAGLLFLVNAVRGGAEAPASLILGALGSLPISILILDFMIPMQLKFGAERSRIVMIVVFGGMTAAGMLLARAFGDVPAVQSAAELLSRMTAAGLIAAAVVLCAAATLISVRVSCIIMERKTF